DRLAPREDLAERVGVEVVRVGVRLVGGLVDVLLVEEDHVRVIGRAVRLVEEAAGLRPRRLDERPQRCEDGVEVALLDRPLDRDAVRHQRSTWPAPPSGPRTRSRSRSGSWSSGTGASASKNVTPPGEWSSCSTPGFITQTSPGRSIRVSSPIVTSTSPSTIAITCSVCSCACRATDLPAWYVTRQSSTCSPPIECSATPGNIVCRSRPVQLPNGDSLIGEDEPRSFGSLARGRRDAADR